jgi:hypothetical protein
LILVAGRRRATVAPLNLRLTIEELDGLGPLATAWLEEQERHIQNVGVPLSARQIADARLAGVQHPERVKVLGVPEIPWPDNPALHGVVEMTRILLPETRSTTIRYGIFIRLDAWDDRTLLVHELVHTAQYERLGGILPFIRQYVHELISAPPGPLEEEAAAVAAKICGADCLNDAAGREG